MISAHNQMWNPNTKPSQVGIWCSGTKSASGGSKSTTFAQGILQLFNLSKMLWIQHGNLPFNPFNIQYTYDSKLHLEKFRNWRLVCRDLHVDTDFEIYGSSIGGWGWLTGSERMPPTGNPSPAPTHPHRTHDTTDQWRDPRWWLGWFLKKSVPFWPDASNVQCISPHFQWPLWSVSLPKVKVSEILSRGQIIWSLYSKLRSRPQYHKMRSTLQE